MNKIKLLIAGALAAAVMLPVFALIPAAAQAASGDVQKGLTCGANGEIPPPGATCSIETDGDPSQKVQDLVSSIISIFSWVVGILSVIMIIYGGFRYVTSGGDSGNVTAAKNTIMFAIVGLVIVALSQVIVKFVIGTVGEITN